MGLRRSAHFLPFFDKMGCTLSAEVDGTEGDPLDEQYHDEAAGARHKSNSKYPVEADWDWTDWGCTRPDFVQAWQKGDTQEMIRIATGDRTGNVKIDEEGADICRDAMEAAIENALSKSNLEIQQNLGRTPAEVDVKDEVIVRMITTLIAAGVSPDIENEETGMTPLMKLCSTQIRSRNAGELVGTRLRVARVLLDRGASVNKADDNGHTALHYLCNTRSTPCAGKNYAIIEEPLMRALVEHKADLERQSGLYGFTPLMYAVMVDNAKQDPQQADRVRLLLKLGASVNTTALPAAGNCTPLILAALKRRCAHGLEDVDDPVHGEKQHTEYDIVREIMACGANVEETAVVKIGSFEVKFPWVKEIEDPDIVSLLKLSKADRFKLWGKYHL